jgi:hypothetical protein
MYLIDDWVCGGGENMIVSIRTIPNCPAGCPEPRFPRDLTLQYMLRKPAWMWPLFDGC